MGPEDRERVAVRARDQGVDDVGSERHDPILTNTGASGGLAGPVAPQARRACPCRPGRPAPARRLPQVMCPQIQTTGGAAGVARDLHGGFGVRRPGTPDPTRPRQTGRGRSAHGMCSRMRHLRLSTVRSRLICLVLVAMFPALALAVYEGLTGSREAASRARDEALRIARLVAHEEAGRLEGARQFLVALARIPAVRSLDGPASTRLFQDLLKRFPQYANLSVPAPDC